MVTKSVQSIRVSSKHVEMLHDANLYVLLHVCTICVCYVKNIHKVFIFMLITGNVTFSVFKIY